MNKDNFAMKVILVLVAFGLGACASSYHTPTFTDSSNFSKDDDLNSLLEKLNFKEVAMQAIANVLYAKLEESIRPSRELTTAQKDRLRAYITLELEKIYIENKEVLNQVMSEYKTVYDSFYTHSEIVELNKFYGTPVGKKTVALSAQITPKLIKVGEKFGYIVGQKFAERLAKQSRYPTSLKIDRLDWQPR